MHRRCSLPVVVLALALTGGAFAQNSPADPSPDGTSSDAARDSSSGSAMQGAVATDALLTVLGVPNLSYEHFFGPVGVRAGVGAGSLAYFVPARLAEAGVSFSLPGAGGFYLFAGGNMSRLEHDGDTFSGTTVTGGGGYRKRFGRFYLDGYVGIGVRSGDEVDIEEQRGNATLAITMENGPGFTRGLRLGIAL